MMCINIEYRDALKSSFCSLFHGTDEETR